MNIAEILDAFSRTDDYQLEAVDAALAQREAITPALIQLLEEVYTNPADFEKRVDHLYALFLLSHFKAGAAHPVMAKLLRLPDDLPDLLFNELITEKFVAFLYRTYDNDPAPCIALMADQEADEFCRGTGAEVLVFAVAEDRLDRATASTALANVLANEPHDSENGFLWTYLTYQLHQLHPAAHMELIRSLYAADLIISTVIDLDEIERMVTEGTVEEALARAKQGARKTATDDLHEELSDWLEDFTSNFGVDPETIAGQLSDESEGGFVASATTGDFVGDAVGDSVEDAVTPKPKKVKKQTKNKRKMVKASRKKNRRK